MGGVSILDVIIVVVIVLGVVGVGLYFLNKWAYKKMDEQQSIIARTSQVATIYVIDKRKEKPTNSNLPKSVIEQLPRRASLMKMPLVKAKVGPQIMTLICDKKVFEALPVKKNVKVDISGIYITNMKGMKTDKEMKALIKERKTKAQANK